MVPELFVDTSAWYSLVDRNAPEHGRLADVIKTRITAGVTLVTTNLVLAETQVLIMRRIGRDSALAFLLDARAAPNVVVFSTPEREELAEREWLSRYSDQAFSLTDAVSFAVMAERGIGEALALDKHFVTAGFTLA
jgi:uncharacterized protein